MQSMYYISQLKHFHSFILNSKFYAIKLNWKYLVLKYSLECQNQQSSGYVFHIFNSINCVFHVTYTIL